MAAAGSSNSHQQAEIRNETIVRTENSGSQAIAGSATVPRLGPADFSSYAQVTTGSRGYHRRMPTLIAHQCGCIRLPRVFVLVGRLRCRDGRHHETWSKVPRESPEQPGSKAWRVGFVRDSNGSKLMPPNLCMLCLRLGQLQKKILAHG